MYLQATLRVVWAQQGQTPVIKLHSGRENTHFYGALNLLNGQETVLRSDEMNGEISASFLQLILQTYPELPLILLWDRATWHQGPLIKTILEANPRLQIIYFPAGSPDLNPQEHVWKTTREAISHNHSERKLDKLAQAFEAHLNNNTFPSSLLEKYDYIRLCMMFN
jgi:transposase